MEYFFCYKIKTIFIKILSFFIIFLSFKCLANEIEPTKLISFEKVLPLAFENNKILLISVNNHKSSKLSYKASKSVLYPKLDLTANIAEQDDSNPNSVNENFSPREYKIKVTQNLWDFNQSNSTVLMSSLRTKLSEINIVETKQNIILKAARAYSNYRKARSQFFLSLDFEKKLKNQTGMQDYRIKQGAAISTDLLQSKNALAKAITSRVVSYGNFQRSAIAFQSTFNFTPDLKTDILPINVPLMILPKNRETYIKTVLKSGLMAQKIEINKKISDILKDNSFASNFLPKFTLTGEINHKDNYAGTAGFLTENIVKVEMKWPIELFGTQIDKFKSSLLLSDNALTQYLETLKNITDSSNSKWINFQNEKTNLEFINNQVNIAKEFLKMSDLEFKKGRGNMNIVISAQNAFYNSQTSLKEAVANFALTSYSVLSDVNQLTLRNISN
jgi:outer membrane protein TolC